jgi:hypothetical protein
MTGFILSPHANLLQRPSDRLARTTVRRPVIPRSEKPLQEPAKPRRIRPPWTVIVGSVLRVGLMLPLLAAVITLLITGLAPVFFIGVILLLVGAAPILLVTLAILLTQGIELPAGSPASPKVVRGC